MLQWTILEFAIELHEVQTLGDRSVHRFLHILDHLALALGAGVLEKQDYIDGQPDRQQTRVGHLGVLVEVRSGEEVLGAQVEQVRSRKYDERVLPLVNSSLQSGPTKHSGSPFRYKKG